MPDRISFIVAFLAGISSFFSPCILPLLPVYISFITGLSIDELKDYSSTIATTRNVRKILGNIILFVFGFSTVFVILGATASSLGNLIIRNQKILRTVGGIVIILFGLHILGFLKIKYLQHEKRINLTTRPFHALSSFIFGITFALGWTPCVGPILAVILTLAATRETLYKGVLLLGCYSLGLAIPFFVTGLAVNKLLIFSHKIGKYGHIISVVSALFLIIIGILLLLSGHIIGMNSFLTF